MNDTRQRGSPLAGVRVIEVTGIGPVPHAGMLLADLGAKVTRIDPPEAEPAASGDVTRRGKIAVTLNFKDAEDLERLREIIDHSDVLLEGSRPGVLERLEVGPEACHKRNPGLIYGRMTGWGQQGPMAGQAGHDLNYIARSGALYGLGQSDGAPQFPLNLLGDYGGGSMYLVAGVLSALVQRAETGKGQVVDAAIMNGTTHLMANVMGMMNMGMQSTVPRRSLLDGGAPFYRVYRTADGRHVSVGSIEPKFFAILVERTGIDFDPQQQYDRRAWPRLREQLELTFAQRTLDHWTTVFDGTDGCVVPVLSLLEASADPQVRARDAIIVGDDGTLAPGPPVWFSPVDS